MPLLFCGFVTRLCLFVCFVPTFECSLFYIIIIFNFIIIIVIYNYYYIINIIVTICVIQWNLRITDNLGPGILSVVRRLVSLGGQPIFPLKMP